MESNGSSNLDGQPLLDAVLDEQNVRWGQGDRPAAEEFFERFPALRGNPDAALDVIYQEVLLRRDLGERPQPEEFIRRFPFLSKLLIIAQFAADEAMRSAEAPTGPPGDEGGGLSADDADATTLGDAAGADDRGAFPSFPGYELIGVIGQGGMGVVYKARNTRLGRVVALKTITELDLKKPSQTGRFLDEARAAARLQHPNIITVHEIGEHQGRPYFVQEFVDGGDLKKRLADKPMAVRASAELVETLAGAVHAAHKAGIVHRDLKPSNILLTTEGVPKVADFGLAKLVGGDSGRTQSGQVVGTPSYMAPEQAEGRSRDVGPAADVYALGTILYEALTGRPPFLGDTQIETLRLVCSAEPVPPKQSRPDIPRDLETICLKCLEKEPSKRYASGELLAGDLRRFLDDQPITARPVGPAGRLWRWRRRNPKVAALSAAVLMSLLVGTGVSTTLAIRAIRAEEATRQQRDRAELEAETARTVNDFLSEILRQATPSNQARIDRRADPNLKLRVALDYAAETIGERFGRRPLVEAATRLTIGEDYMELGLSAQARPHLERALELRRKRLGEHDPSTLIAKCRLGMALLYLGIVTEAEPLLVSAMEGLLNTKGTTDPEALEAMRALGGLYVNQNKFAEGQGLLKRVLAGFRAGLGPDHYHSLNAASEFALSLGAQDPKEAVRSLKEAIALAAEKVGPEHPATLTAMYNLAYFQEALGQKDEADTLMEKVWRMQQVVLGNNHPETLSTMAMLGHFYVKHHKFDKAEPLLLDALNECRKSLDRNHLTTDLVVGSLAAIHTVNRDVKKAVPYLLEAYEITRAQYGLDEGLTDVATRNLAMAYLALEDLSKAEPFFREHLAYLLRHQPDDPSRYRAEGEVGLCLIARKAYPEAEKQLLFAHQWIVSKMASTPPELVVEFQRNEERVIKLYEALGDREQAGAWRIKRSDLDFPWEPFVP
jgi:eukaryotic-like serine/threonine-protein kinase